MPARALRVAVAALVVVAVPVLVYFLLGVPELALPSQWADAEADIADGGLPSGYIVNIIAGLLLLAWAGGLGLLVSMLIQRDSKGSSTETPGADSAGFEPVPSSDPSGFEPVMATGLESQGDAPAEAGSDEPWYRQGPPIFDEPFSDDYPRVVVPPEDDPPVESPSGAVAGDAGFPPEMAPPSPIPEDGTTGAEIVGEPAAASSDEPPMIVPVRAYYFTRAGDTLRSIAAQFLRTPMRWEELRGLNAASPGMAGAGPDTLLPVGTALAIPGDPVPWGNPDPVYLWTLAEKFLFTAWGREPTPEEVAPFWRGLASGQQLGSGGAPPALPQHLAALPAEAPAAATGFAPEHAAPADVAEGQAAPEPAIGAPTAPEPTIAAPAAMDPSTARHAGQPSDTVAPDEPATPVDESVTASDFPAPPGYDQPPPAYESPVPPSHETPPPGYDQPPPPAYESVTASDFPAPPGYDQPPPAYESPVPPSHEPAAAPHSHDFAAPPAQEPSAPAFDSPVPASHEPAPPTAPRQPGEVDLGPVEPETETEYAEAEAPRMPSFMPSLTGAEAAAAAPEAQVVSSANRSLAGTTIGDAMMLWQLSRLRRRGDRRDEFDPLEESLKQNARTDSLSLIEAAMRHLRAVTVGQLREKPSVLAVRVGTYGFEVLLNRPVQAPEGWQAASGGYVLELPQGVTADDLNTVGQGPTLCPALVPVGDTVEGPLLLNVEEIGCLIVSGPPSPSISLLNAVVGTLGSSPLAADIRIITVGLETPLGVPGWDRVHSTSFDSPQLEELISTAHTGGGASLDILVVGPGNDLLIQRAGQVASTPGSRLAVVGSTSSVAARWPWRIHVDETTTAVVHPIACTMAAAQATAPAMSQLLSEASDPSLLAPPRF
ncbi:MAG: hypothetical protein F4Z34_04425 [Acidimicrobiaceae bacterium]|nr:hypothetical protein [Acidimicrobiaceae bacterium]